LKLWVLEKLVLCFPKKTCFFIFCYKYYQKNK